MFQIQILVTHAAYNFSSMIIRQFQQVTHVNPASLCPSYLWTSPKSRGTLGFRCRGSLGLPSLSRGGSTPWLALGAFGCNSHHPTGNEACWSSKSSALLGCRWHAWIQARRACPWCYQRSSSNGRCWLHKTTAATAIAQAWRVSPVDWQQP